MSSSETNPPMTQRFQGDVPKLSDDRRRRKCNKQRISQSYFSTLTAFTIAATCLISSVTAFTSTGSRPSLEQRHIGPSASRSRSPDVGPFGTVVKSLPLVSSTRLFTSDDLNSDKDEWRALLAAFQLYKAAYGDLKVPTRFVVPSMKPWPEATWDLKLGQKVGQIRATGKHVDGNQRRRKQLEKLGFVWRARAETKSAVDSTEIPFDQIYDALCVYRKEVKPTGFLTVPLQFTVPESYPWPENTRGLPLGRNIEKLRSKAYLRENPGSQEKLKEIGFELDTKVSANDIRFQNVYSALKRYQDIYGDLLVPQPFEVPVSSADWPEDTWGLRLGARVNAIRSQETFVKNNPERREILDELGFVWSPPESERRKRGRKSKAEKEQEEKEAFEAASLQAATRPVEAATEDKDEASDVDSFVASFDFSLGANDAAGEENISPTWGFEGGSEFQDVVAAAQEEAAQQAVQDEYRPPQTLEESLRDARARAIEVGIVQEGEGKTLLKGKREREIPWFNDDFGGDFVFEDVVEGLTLYKSFYGDFSNLTNEEFVIPILGETPPPFDSDDEFDDADMLENDPSTRAAAAIARFDEFDDLAMTEDMIEAEISRLEGDALNPETKGETAVATLSPTVDADWPEHLGGLRLGNIVARIRDGSLEVKHLAERKDQLDAIDFDWGDAKYWMDVPFEKAMCAMYAYYLVRGDMFVPPTFSMPDEDPWPQALAGYEIGPVVRRIRELQNFLEAYHPDKVSLLRMIDFVWFPTLALPIDPNEPEVTPEMLRLSALGHPDYAKMIDIPMGLPDKIIADGPFFDSDDPKMWWRKWHNWEYVEDFWYQNGRRDNAFVLRGMGYPQMAAEHEEKYGPGLFTQLEETLDRLEEGGPVKSAEEKVVLIEKMKYFRSELAGCNDIHPQNLDKLVEELDIQMLELVTGKKGGSVEKQLEAALAEYEEEEIEGDKKDYEEEEVEEEFEEEESPADDEELDIDEELGLDSTEKKT